jgi:hypothetical protein
VVCLSGLRSAFPLCVSSHHDRVRPMPWARERQSSFAAKCRVSAAWSELRRRLGCEVKPFAPLPTCIRRGRGGRSRASIVSLTLAAAIDGPARFKSSKLVGAYFGLTPTKHQSGETDIDGRISKIGDAWVRAGLYEAANIILTKPLKGCTALQSWAMKLARRSRMKKAKVALAPKLAVIIGSRSGIRRRRRCGARPSVESCSPPSSIIVSTKHHCVA